jgi:5-oxoprolinase (ATP-hydrolysing)
MASHTHTQDKQMSHYGIPDHEDSSDQKFRFSIDRGGTFTDIYAEVPPTKYNNYQRYVIMKLLSVDPANYDDAPREGIRRIISQVLNKKIPTAKDIDTKWIEWIRMGTTVATNALLERKGEKCALLTTKGFKDLLKIGNQSRPKIFDLVINKPSLLYSSVIEIEERVQLLKSEPEQQHLNNVRRGVSGEFVRILQEPDYEKVRSILEQLHREEKIDSVAVVFLHSYTFHDHELKVGQIAKEIGFSSISLSHQIMPMVRAVPRGHTTCVDAYLTPIIRQYVQHFCEGFADDFLQNVSVTFMQSDGGLTPATDFLGCRAILSGPAGGVVGYAATAYDFQHVSQDPNAPQVVQAVIGFDMGGTSTDVSRYAGTFEHVYETETAGVTIQSPQLHIETVAAGGGSRLFFTDSGMFVVGPESSGAHPGPVCYRKGGYLSITDANLFLGRILPDYFPKIFGPKENEPLDYEATRKAFEELTEKVNQFQRKNNLPDMTPEEVAYGFIQVANESMSRPIRSMTVAKGYDTRDHILACFGGAGAQHAAAIAENLGMKKVMIHKYSGVLSAYGLSLADVVAERQEPCSKVWSQESYDNYIRDRLMSMREQVIQELTNEKNRFKMENVETEEYVNLRYKGTDYNIMTRIHLQDPNYNSVIKRFEHRYKTEYGFVMSGRDILVDDLRVRGIGKTRSSISEEEIKNIRVTKRFAPTEPIAYSKTYFENGWQQVPIYKLNSLRIGTEIPGPCIIIHETTTIVVIPNAKALITPPEGNVEITFKEKSKKEYSETVDPILLSIFAHRFMSIAEQMGRTLQRTSISTNIKERLDFSCAIFGPEGGLVANAPHLPVHLGSMSEAVKFQIQYLKEQGLDWMEGDVLVSNHPAAGGTHLPDITVITPVLDKETKKPVFFVANRGHHADIGGISPGSMPPFSRRLSEEGAAIKSFKLVQNSEFQLEGITKILKDAGSRNLKDNIADLKAQVAANQKGIGLIYDLIAQYTLPVVHAYMRHVQDNAQLAVTQMLQTVFDRFGDPNKENIVLTAEDFMDDGSKIHLRLTIFNQNKMKSIEGICADFDFRGTSPMVLGNTNAPRAITVSAILYCLRCLVKREIPLNEGCLKPISLKIDKYSLLDIGDSDVGVVGGNVLTSQRLTDVILKAFQACAASQGCMNNLTFGSEKMGYYETIAGGAGAGPTWHGCDSVHTHMTNTRITDVEILEKRYPILLRQFSVRKDSGGKGKFKGGDGVVREFEFLEPLHVGILSERRVFQPYGLHGGEPGATGLNLYVTSNGLIHNLGAKNAFQLNAGDRVMICTPGGVVNGNPK